MEKAYSKSAKEKKKTYIEFSNNNIDPFRILSTYKDMKAKANWMVKCWVLTNFLLEIQEHWSHPMLTTTLNLLCRSTLAQPK